MLVTAQTIKPELQHQLQAFALANNFVDLYRSYLWREDTSAKGFPDILRLELTLTASDRTTGVTLDDVRAVARWGAMRNQGRISGPQVVLPPNTFHLAVGVVPTALAVNPLAPLILIQAQLKGLGPTYLSKILRFAQPQVYGAIDTRCVRVFGIGDLQAHRCDWLSLRARNDGYGWYIPKAQSDWPDQYGLWINILRHFASTLPHNCPHPPGFVANGLRQQGIWQCGDVEMALFAFASQYT